MERAVVLIECPDQKGIIARVSDFIFQHDANIIQSDQYSSDPENGVFFMRLEFCFDPKRLSRDILEKEFGRLAKKMRAHWSLHYHSTRMRMGILLSKEAHCLVDILYRQASGEFHADITCVSAIIRIIAQGWSKRAYLITMSRLPKKQFPRAKMRFCLLFKKIRMFWCLRVICKYFLQNF